MSETLSSIAPEVATAALAGADACPGCQSPGPFHAVMKGRDRLTGQPGEFRVVRCSACALAFTEPRLSPEELSRFYTGHYFGTTPGGATRPRTSLLDRARHRFLAQRGAYRRVLAQPPGRVLDVGCGRGKLAETFARHGWQVAGVEPSPEAAEEASRRGVDVHTGTLNDAPWAPQTFDAVVMNHSLEHIPEPADALGHVEALLKPGGIVVVAVPNFGCWQRRLFGEDWFQLDLPRHLQHFERATLERLLERAGFEIDATETRSMRPGLPSSIQYRFLGGLRIPGSLYSKLVWLTYPLLLACDVVSQGDCLHVTASKRAA